MIKISLELAKLHPAFVASLPKTVEPEKVREAINLAIREAGGESSGAIRSKNVKDSVRITASGKLEGLSFRKDSPAGLAARVNWYLFGAAELFTRVETVTLPHSVGEWLEAKEFAKEPAPAPAS